MERQRISFSFSFPLSKSPVLEETGKGTTHHVVVFAVVVINILLQFEKANKLKERLIILEFKLNTTLTNNLLHNSSISLLFGTGEPDLCGI